MYLDQLRSSENIWLIISINIQEQSPYETDYMLLPLWITLRKENVENVMHQM